MRRNNNIYMATYKKRGNKPKSKVDKRDLLEKQSTTAEVFSTLDQGASKTEEWVAKNQKYIFIVIAIVAVVVLGSLGYSKYIQEPKEIEAKNNMYQAQVYFDEAVNGVEKDSLYNMALTGGEGQFGMLDIIENHSGTDAANLANYYAGMAYLKLSDYQNAVEHLDAFKSDDEMLGPLAKGGIGDAFVQLEQFEDAFDYYQQAANIKTNDFTTPMFLFKAATVAMKLLKYNDALGLYTRIKEDFASSNEATNIDVYIGRAEALAK